MSAIRIIKHEAVPQCGSFEVRYPDGRPSQYFYWDDLPGRRLNPATLDRETALEQAKALARRASDALALLLRACAASGVASALARHCRKPVTNGFDDIA